MTVLNIDNIKQANIYVIALGGTIASSINTPEREFYSSPTTDIDEIIAALPIDKSKITIKCEQFLQKISQELTENDLIALATKIQKLLNFNEIDGIVVTQGTNCIEEVAYFINLVINTQKPIIFTGAFRPHKALGFDGLRNLYNAIILASHKELGHLGTILTFNDAIVSARDAMKSNPSMLNELSCNGSGLLGQIQGQNIHIQKMNAFKHTYLSEFRIDNIEFLPKVCIIYGHLGMDSVFIETAIANDFKGIISAGMGKGYQSKEVTAMLKTAADKGLFIARCSRTGQGIVNIEEALDKQNGFIAGGSLSPQKARMLLSIAICHTNDTNEIQRIFEQY